MIHYSLFFGKFHCKVFEESQSEWHGASHYLLDIADTEESLNCLKNGKVCGTDGLTKENVIYTHPSVVIYLKMLFSIIIDQGFVPNNLGLSVTVPVDKDKTMNMCSADNYRTISLHVSPVI